LEGLAKEDVGIFMAVLSILQPNGILWPFGLFWGHLVYFSILVCCTGKNLATQHSYQRQKWINKSTRRRHRFNEKKKYQTSDLKRFETVRV
jgi:hypothetical protein